MSASRPDDRYQACWEAIQGRACSVCLDLSLVVEPVEGVHASLEPGQESA